MSKLRLVSTSKSSPSDNPRQLLADHNAKIDAARSRLQRFDQLATRASEARAREDDARRALDSHSAADQEAWQRWLRSPEGIPPEPEREQARFLAECLRSAHDDRLAADEKVERARDAQTEVIRELQVLQDQARAIVGAILAAPAARLIAERVELRKACAVNDAALQEMERLLAEHGASVEAEELQFARRNKRRLRSSLALPVPPAAPSGVTLNNAQQNVADQNEQANRFWREKQERDNAVRWPDGRPFNAPLTHPTQSDLLVAVDLLSDADKAELKAACDLERSRWKMLAHYLASGRHTATIATVLEEENI